MYNKFYFFFLVVIRVGLVICGIIYWDITLSKKSLALWWVTKFNKFIFIYYFILNFYYFPINISTSARIRTIYYTYYNRFILIILNFKKIDSDTCGINIETSSRLVYVKLSLTYIPTPPCPSSFCNLVFKVNYGIRLYCIAEKACRFLSIYVLLYQVWGHLMINYKVILAKNLSALLSDANLYITSIEKCCHLGNLLRIQPRSNIYTNYYLKKSKSRYISSSLWLISVYNFAKS